MASGQAPAVDDWQDVDESEWKDVDPLTVQTQQTAAAAGAPSPSKASIPEPRHMPGEPGLSPDNMYAAPVAPAGAAASIPRAIGGLLGGYGANKVVSAFTKNPWVRDIATIGGGLLGEGTGAAAETIPGKFGFTPRTEVNTPIGTFKYRGEQPSTGQGAPEPSRGEFEQNQYADLKKQGKVADIPVRMPKTKAPEEFPAPPVPVRAHAEMENEFASRAAKSPEAVAKRGLAVGEAKSNLVHGRTFEQLTDEEQAQALMRRGREQGKIDEGAPVEGSNQKVLKVPEPNPVPPGENPNNQQSVPRRTTLIQNAKRAKEGAGTQLNQIHGPVLYEPRGAGFSGVRQWDPNAPPEPPEPGPTVSGTKPIVPNKPNGGSPGLNLEPTREERIAELQRLSQSSNSIEARSAKSILDKLYGGGNESPLHFETKAGIRYAGDKPSGEPGAITVSIPKGIKPEDVESYAREKIEEQRQMQANFKNRGQ